MAEWIDIGLEETCPAGEKLVVDTDAGKIAVFHLSQGFYAIEDRCSHDGGDLASGKCEGDNIICPRHGAQFCIRDGKALTPPAYEDIDVFEVRIHKGMIQVDIDS